MIKTNGKNKEAIVFVSLLSFLLTLTLTANAHADSSAIVDFALSVPVACSLSIPTGSSYTSTLTPGANNLIGTSTIKTVCNDASGFAIYVVGYGNDTYGDNTLTATVNDAPVSIATNVTASPTSSTPSEWNMTLANASMQNNYTVTIMNQTSGQNPVGDFTQAHTIPSIYTKVAYRNAGTDAGVTATGANISATFNAYISSTQTAGTYTGSVKFLLIHPNVLTYDSQTGEPDTVQPNTLACEPIKDTFDSTVTHYLQDVSQWKNQVALEQEVTAIDSRDGQSYIVKRLKMSSDGCQSALWMSNLNLGAQALTVNTLDSTNTHLPSDSSKDIATSDFMDWDRTVSGNPVSYTEPKFTPITTSNSSNGLAEDSYGNKYGTLYNYASASAGTYIYAEGAGVGDAEYDLCPSGWRLPTGGSSGEFKQLIADGYSLVSSSDGSTSLQHDLGFPLAGYFYNGAPTGQGGSYAVYWSSTMGGTSRMSLLQFNSSIFSYAVDSDRNSGNSIRCIAQ